MIGDGVRGRGVSDRDRDRGIYDGAWDWGVYDGDLSNVEGLAKIKTISANMLVSLSCDL